MPNGQNIIKRRSSKQDVLVTIRRYVHNENVSFCFQRGRHSDSFCCYCFFCILYIIYKIHVLFSSPVFLQSIFKTQKFRIKELLIYFLFSVFPNNGRLVHIHTHFNEKTASSFNVLTKKLFLTRSIF